MVGDAPQGPHKEALGTWSVGGSTGEFVGRLVTLAPRHQARCAMCDPMVVGAWVGEECGRDGGHGGCHGIGCECGCV
jgi:hypothetical protein